MNTWVLGPWQQAVVVLDFSKLPGYIEEPLLSLSLISSHLSTEYQESLLKLQIRASHITGSCFPEDLALGDRLDKWEGGKEKEK